MSDKLWVIQRTEEKTKCQELAQIWNMKDSQKTDHQMHNETCECTGL